MLTFSELLIKFWLFYPSRKMCKYQVILGTSGAKTSVNSKFQLVLNGNRERNRAQKKRRLNDGLDILL